jgi:hypothetical protein
MEHEIMSDSYDRKVEDISGESSSDTSTSEVEITDSDFDTTVNTQARQWVKCKFKVYHTVQNI